MTIKIIDGLNRHLFSTVAAVYMGDQPAVLLDAQGNSLIGDLPDVPTIVSTVADRTYVVGGSIVTIDAATRFSGAVSYTMTPANLPGVSWDGRIITINPQTVIPTTTITLRGVNAGGTSEPLSFSLTVNAVSPTVTDPLEDQSLTVGGQGVSIPLSDHFSSAASYALDPTGQGVSIASGSLIISAASARNAVYTVTASNSTGQSVSDTFALVVTAAATAPVPFVAGDWSLAAGLEANQLVVDVSSLPANGGSAITAIQYSVDNDAWTALPGAGTGPRTLAMPAASTSYGIRLRAVNAIGNGTPSDTKTATSGAAAPVSAQRVILVSDYAGDCDDAAALAIVAKAHQDGDINLLGVVASSTVATSAPGIRGQLNAYGLQGIPVYAYQGSTGTYNDTFSFAVRDQFGIPGQTRTAFQDDVVGLRTMLAAAPDASVKVIDIGAPVSGARLLDSPADAISPLTGMQLVAAKVVGLWQMAGEFTTTRVEYNADRHIPSTQRLYQDWPTPVIAHGAEVGADLFTGAGPSTTIESDPVKMAFVEFDKAYSGLNSADKRQSWDPACAYHAIYGDSGLFGYGGQNGTITVSSAGVTSFSTTPAGNRSIVTSAGTITAIEAAMQTVIDAIAIPMQPIDFTLAFDEGTGTVVTAEEGAPAFTMSAGATWVASPAHIDLNGTNGRLTTPGNDRFVAFDMLIGAVFRVDATGTLIISAVNGTRGRVYQFRTNGDLEYVSIAPDTTATVISSSPNPTVGQWALGVAFVTDTSVALRLNGVQVGTGTFPQRGKIMGTHPLVIGARSFDGVAFSDHLDGGIAAYRHKTGAVAADIAAFEASLRAIATAKGITLP